MKSNLLYTYLLAGVLLFSGCSSDQSRQVPAEGVADPVESAPDEAGAVERSGEQQPRDMDGTGESLRRRIVFLGDSITAGFGVDEEESFPYLIQMRIEQRELPFTVVNAGFSGGTTSGGVSQIAWILRSPVDILIIELGGNDGLRGVSLDMTRQNLRQIIQTTQDAYPDCRIIVAGMQVPPNIGHEYTETFRNIFPEVATEFGATLIPFILEGVGGIPELNQPDGIHPTSEGHRIVAETVWKTLEPEINIVISGSR